MVPLQAASLHNIFWIPQLPPWEKCGQFRLNIRLLGRALWDSEVLLQAFEAQRIPLIALKNQRALLKVMIRLASSANNTTINDQVFKKNTHWMFLKIQNARLVISEFKIFRLWGFGTAGSGHNPMEKEEV
jgi:hypothetical protein